MPSSHRFIGYTDLLTKAQIDQVSGIAARLFTQAWNRMAYRDCNPTTIPDAEALERCHIEPWQLKAAQAELVRVNWLHIERFSETHCSYALPSQD